MLSQHSFLFDRTLTSRDVTNQLKSLDCLETLSTDLLSLIGNYCHLEEGWEGFDKESQVYRYIGCEADPETLELAKNEYRPWLLKDLFHEAIAQGQIKTVKYMLESKKAEADEQVTIGGFNGNRDHRVTFTPLTNALWHGRFGIAHLLLDKYENEIKRTINSEFESRGASSWPSTGTALSIAIGTGHQQIILKLLSLGATVPDRLNLTALKSLLINNHHIPYRIKEPLIQWLIAKEMKRFDDKPIEILKYLLDYDQLIDQVKKQGRAEPYQFYLFFNHDQTPTRLDHRVTKRLIQWVMNKGNIKIIDPELSEEHIKKLKQILECEEPDKGMGLLRKGR